MYGSERCMSHDVQPGFTNGAVNLWREALMRNRLACAGMKGVIPTCRMSARRVTVAFARLSMCQPIRHGIEDELRLESKGKQSVTRKGLLLLLLWRLQDDTTSV